jgi:hypothetical protein
MAANIAHYPPRKRLLLTKATPVVVLQAVTRLKPGTMFTVESLSSFEL